MGKRTAPYLQAVLEENREGSFAWAMAVRELRALIAVAKAAQRVKAYIVEESQHPTTCEQEAGWDNCAIDVEGYLDAALARLARASGEGGK